MHKSYQLQLVLVHAQVLFAGSMAYDDLIMSISNFLLKSETFGVQNVDYLNLIPWFCIFQLYALLIPKAVSIKS